MRFKIRFRFSSIKIDELKIKLAIYIFLHLFFLKRLQNEERDPVSGSRKIPITNRKNEKNRASGQYDLVDQDILTGSMK